MTSLENKLKDAWLNIEVNESELFNPLSILDEVEDIEQYIERITWLMAQSEYFAFITKYVLNLELAPFQYVVLQEIWNKKFPMLIGSRGMSKSFTMAVYCILRCLLMPRRKIIVVGAAFRQSKVIFEYMETIWKNAPILRDLCDKDSGPSRDIDRCVLRINGGTITCLPLGNGEKIRGQRANDIIADEFACLKEGSLVETDKGLIRVEDFETAADCHLPTGDDRCIAETPEKFIKTPLTDVYEIKLDNGYVIRCSEKHQVMTSNGWKKPIELKSGDWIEKSDIGWISKQRYFDEKIAWLMGVLVSEGSITHNSNISIKTTDIKLVEKLVNSFGWSFSIRDAYIDNRGWNCKESYEVYTTNNKLRNQLYEWGLDYVTAHDKKIPWSILQSDESIVKSFLSGLFDGDGSCFLWKDREIENRIGLAYYSVSERLCRDVQIVMNKLGYDGYINSRDSKISENRQWFVRWNNKTAFMAANMLSVDRFMSAINLCSLPDDPTYITLDSSRSKWKASIKYCDKQIQKRFNTLEEAKDFVSEIKARKQFRRVVSIEKLEKQEHLYDYYLPITNSFYAEGHRQHNSIPRDIFENVVAGFASVSASPIENIKIKASKKKAKELGVIWEDHLQEAGTVHATNQIILSGTAYYEFNHFAQYWKKYKSIIETKGNHKKLTEVLGSPPSPDFNWADYTVLRIPVNYLPEGFMDEAQIERARATVHSGIFQMEYGSVFTSDSQGFFKRSLIESCCVSHENPVKLPSGTVFFEPLLTGSQQKQYIYGVDPASEVDNFSIVILEVNEDHRRIVHCWTTNRQEHKNRVKIGLAEEDDFYSYCARKIRNFMKIFPCREIAMDSQGGGIAVMEALHDKDKIKDGELPIWPTIDPESASDTDDMPGLHILKMCNFAKADWLSEANHGLRKDMEDKVLLFPYFDAVSLGLSSELDNLENRLYDTREDCILEIEELKSELSMIVITQTQSGRERWDTPESKIGVNKKMRLRKDRYSALLMANMSARLRPSVNIIESYTCIGGFAQSYNSNDSDSDDEDLYYGPQWWSPEY